MLRGPGGCPAPISCERCWLRLSIESWKRERPRSGSRFPVSIVIVAPAGLAPRPPTAFFLFLFLWVRWTLPRFRFDQLMHLGWKVFLPLALANLFITGLVVSSGLRLW